MVSVGGGPEASGGMDWKDGSWDCAQTVVGSEATKGQTPGS